MKWDDCRLLDGLCYDLVLADYPRGLNRARIDSINNGEPPYTEEEVLDNNIEVNINDLTHTRLVHDARAQMTNSLLKTGNNFTCRTDYPPIHSRDKISTVVTNCINKQMRRSNRYIQYYERQRAKSGLLMLHGISPGCWENEDSWCTVPLSVGDVLIPGQTKLGFTNMPLYVLRRSFTAIELQHLTQKSVRDPGWKMPQVEACLKWADSQMTQLRSTNWPDLWKPEAVQQRIKGDGGYYLGDAVPTIDCFDIYGYVDDGKESGWIRRIILDSWGEPQRTGVGSYSMTRQNRGDIDKGAEFLFSSGERKVGSNWQQMICFSFADLSGVFPATYHTIRSLGWMIYASCHIGMRMRCKFWESVFETLNMMFEVDSMDDAQRALQLNLTNRTFIDKSIRPVKAADRWQVNTQLVELGLQDNQKVISENSSSFTQNQNYSQDRTEKTKFQVMAELQAVTQLVSAGLNQAYQYEAFEDREIFRRFMRKNSTDPDVRIAQANILRKLGSKAEKYLVPEAWDIEHERVMGGGNKTMEMAIAQWLMENREKYDPDSQRVILRDATLAVTDNPDKAEELVPEEPVVSSSVHDAQLASSTMLMGLPMAFKSGVNHQEYAAALIGSLTSEVAKVMQFKGGVPDQDTLAGMQNLAGVTIQGQEIPGNGARAHIAVLEGDDTAKQVAKQLNDALGKQMNEVKGFAQRLQEAAKKAQEQNGNGQMDPKDIAKVKAMEMQAQVKAKNAEQSHAQKTAQRAIAFEQKTLQDKQKFQQELLESSREHAANLAKTDLEAASTLQRNRLASTEEE